MSQTNPEQSDSQDVTFTVTVTMRRRWVPHFLSFLRHMETLGNIGASRTVSFYSDGDGDFRPEFDWDAEIELAPTPRTRHWDAG